MKLNCVEDADTAFIEFTSQRVAETRSSCDNIHIDLDAQGNLVSMKIEHTEKSTNILEAVCFTAPLGGTNPRRTALSSGQAALGGSVCRGRDALAPRLLHTRDGSRNFQTAS